jgi:hypothetical protein
MKLAAWVVVIAVTADAACACKGSGSGGTGPGTGAGPGTGVVDASACDGQAGHVRDLYQALAGRTDLTAVEIDDNVAMVMAECKAAPARVVPCLTKVTAVAPLEATCLAPLDDEGRDGQVFLGK